MTDQPEPKKKLSLQEQLDEKNRLEREKKESSTQQAQEPLNKPEAQPIVDPPIPIAEDGLSLKQYQEKLDKDSLRETGKTLKEREKLLADTEREFQASLNEFANNKTKWETEQKSRMDAYNENVRLWNNKNSVLNEKLKEADKRTEETIALKAEAKKILDNQTAEEKERQAKLASYEKNMTECIDIFSEIADILSRKGYSVGRILTYDLALIERMQERKSSLSSIADVIAADCGRLDEICEELQKSGKEPELLTYLTDNVEFLQTSLKIEWFAPTTEGTLK